MVLPLAPLAIGLGGAAVGAFAGFTLGDGLKALTNLAILGAVSFVALKVTKVI